jgi:flagellar motor switch protein FliN/FliY
MISASKDCGPAEALAKDGDMSSNHPTVSESTAQKDNTQPRTGDGDVNVRIEVGSVALSLAQLAQIHDGHVIPLDQAADAPVELFVGDRLIARGQVVLIREHYCVQLTELVDDSSIATRQPI